MKILPHFIRRKISQRPNLQNIIDNIGWLFFERFLRLCIGLFIGVWLARYLGPEQFGLFNYASAFVALFATISSLGLKDIVVRDLVKNPDVAGATLGTAVVLRLIAGLVALILIVLTISWLRAEDELSKYLVAILSLTLLLKTSDIIKYWFESQVQSRYVIWVESSVFITLAIIKIFLILNHAQLVVFIWLVVAEAFFVALGLIAIYLKKAGSFNNWAIGVHRAGELLKDAWPLALSGIAIMVYMRIDQIMLGEILDNEAVGIYSAAVKISELWYMIPIIIASSLFPTIIKTKLSNEQHYLERMQSLMNLLALFALVTAITVTLAANWIILLLFAQDFAPAGNILKIHVWACIFVFLGVAGSRWYVVENLQKLNLYRLTGGAIINVCLNLVLIPQYGGTGAAASTVLSYAFAAYLLDFTSQRTRNLFWLKTRAIFLGPLKLMLDK
ncbi:MAG: flippase [Pseudomonadales bacterium]|nr:flippase [Pseudomonadales bacterium]